MDDHPFVTDSPARLSSQVERYHQLMLDLSVSFINLPLEELESAIDLAMGRMASFFEADRAYVFRYDFRNGVGTNNHEWCAPGIEPAIDQLQNVPRMEIALDITERKAAEKAMQESELRYRRLFDNSRDALMIVAPPDWQLITCNAATIENHPLSVALDAWVLREALEQINRWSGEQHPLPVSINLSAATLQQGQFAAMLKSSLARWPSIATGLLEIEILESSALGDIESISAMIRRCRELGVRFALDDFGVGYSSLTYLKRLPANTLKIDRSFVRDMLDDADDLAILKAILGLATAFGLEVIAEGVETADHGEKLLELGIEQAQGYFIARPMPASQITDWRSGWRPPASWLHQESAD